MPTKPEAQEKLGFLGYRNMLEKLAERYHTTPETIVALNGPDKLIGMGQTLKLPNVVPQSRDYDGAIDKQAPLLAALNVDANQRKGDFVVVDKSEGTLKVYQGTFPTGEGDWEEAGTARLIAQFPVTTGSSHDPLPLGNWKVTTYSFLPPFHYQPDLFWDVSDAKDEHKLPPGPNGLVGVAWLDLTKDHYGIHGTPEPRADRQVAKPWLLAHDQLGRNAAVAYDEAGLPGQVRRLGGSMGKAFAVTSTAVVTATLTSAFWIFAFNTGVLATADARKVEGGG